MKPKEAVTFDSAGTIIVKRAQDAEPVMEAMKAYGDLLKHSRSRVAGAKMVGSIDSITASIWAKECGSGIGTKEFSAYAKKKLSDPDYRRFRVGG